MMVRSMLAGALLCLSFAAAQSVAATPADHWVGTWATAPYEAKNTAPKPPAAGTTPATPARKQIGSEDMTFREIVHVSVGGPMMRVVFTNEFGTEPLMIGAARVAMAAEGGALKPGTSGQLTFNGKQSISIPAGALAVSDPVAMNVPAFADLAISFYLPQQTISALSQHGNAVQSNYIVPGNMVDAATLDSPQTVGSWSFVKGVDVQLPSNGGAVVAFGDSITDGAYVTRDSNMRWPDELARRLGADKKTKEMGVLNEGIGGNRILHDGTGPSALARFTRDVVGQAGVRYVIVLEGINDIGHAYDPNRTYDVVTADDLIQGFAQMAERAHAHGIKIIGATLTPYVGAKYASTAGEKVRVALNEWIRTTKMLDGVIDFDKATRDPQHPDMYLPSVEHGDHLHPQDAGYKLMGDAIDLGLFTK
jgi:lysophospholipase L1-like esterase